MRRRFIRTLTTFFALKFVRIFFHIVVVRIDVSAFNKFGPLSVEEMKFLFAAIGKLKDYLNAKKMIQRMLNSSDLGKYMETSKWASVV